MHNINEDIETVFADEKKLAEICDRVAKELMDTYAESGRELVFVVTLKGAALFATDLLRRLPIKCDMEFMKVSSYGAGTSSSGTVNVQLDMKRDVSGCDVVVIEDIVDSGRTLAKLYQMLKGRGAHSVRCCTLLDKPDRRQVPIKADFVGFEIPDVFVVGYGLDYDEAYRNLPYVGVLKPSVYAK